MQQINSKVMKKVMQSSLSPALVFPDLQVKYPRVVIEALTQLYDETNEAFNILVNANREWITDYRYCYSDCSVMNQIIQIDMCGLSDDLLMELSSMSIEEASNILRERIFEMENNWALYQILSSVYSSSLYSIQTKAMLDSIRLKHGMKVALLAVTEDKYHAMKATEFGKDTDSPLSKEEIYSLSGFDNFFSPNEFMSYIDSVNNKSEYLFYVRSSDPIEKLKDPKVSVNHELLSDEKFRRIIKEYSITLNIDNPSWLAGDPRRINDTKRYMPLMSLGFPIETIEDFNSNGFLSFLESKGICPDEALSGAIRFRAKPIQGTYGCYGHMRGCLTEGKFKSKLRQGLSTRGTYIIQPELEPPTLLNIHENNRRYAFIDRIFIGKIDGISSWMGGHRELLPYDSHEVQSGRLHGNKEAVFMQIL